MKKNVNENEKNISETVRVSEFEFNLVPQIKFIKKKQKKKNSQSGDWMKVGEQEHVHQQKQKTEPEQRCNSYNTILYISENNN